MYERKNVIVAACCAAMGAAGLPTAASAAEAGLELSVYGVGHMSGDRIDTGPSSGTYIHSNSSRLGFKGSRNLDRGNAVLFQYESGVDLTGNGVGDGNGGATSDGQLFTRARDAFVGGRGEFGSVVLGRLGGLNEWLYDYNLFGDQVGDLGNIWGGDGLPGRLNNVVKYTTPGLGGFALGLTYAPNQGVPDTDGLVAKVDYGRAGFKVGGAYAKFGQGAGLRDNKVGAITASYGSGAFTVGGGLQRETDIAGVSGRDQSKYTLGAGVKLGGAGMLKGQYAQARDKSGVADSGARQMALGFDWGWSADTTLYVAYARTDNGKAASYSADNYGHGNQGVPAIAAGAAPKGLSVGVVYKFDAGLVGRR